MPCGSLLFVAALQGSRSGRVARLQFHVRSICTPVLARLAIVPDVQVCSELRCFGPQLSDRLDLFVAVSIKLQVVLSSVLDADVLGSCFLDVVRCGFVSVAL